MAGWDLEAGQAVVLARDNIDTDQLIPARFMSQPRSAGYGSFLLYDLRRTADGTLDADFPLNHTVDAQVLIAGRNFGSGSSREAAVYALVDAGFRAVVAESFGDIFAANAVNNGLLPAQVTPEVARTLSAVPQSETVAVDLPNRTLGFGGERFAFALQDAWQRKLLNGWDDIDITLQERDTIAAYWTTRQAAAPWARPARDS